MSTPCIPIQSNNNNNNNNNNNIIIIIIIIPTTFSLTHAHTCYDCVQKMVLIAHNSTTIITCYYRLSIYYSMTLKDAFIHATTSL